MVKILAKFGTAGDGLWSKRVIHNSNGDGIPILKMELDTLYDPNHHGKGKGHEWGSLQVFFDPTIWNTVTDGLIYTDSRWIKDLRKYLRSQGFSRKATNDVTYSEQGRQGRNFVDLDVSEAFISEAVPLSEPLYHFVQGKRPGLIIHISRETISH